mmetsp:Transcript_23978/g.77396  ORF Transcript_23978/g.77396 Transcript_23978/m.77396 type:complete len:241 (+) Transcript_23978:447-1169(+)
MHSPRVPSQPWPLLRNELEEEGLVGVGVEPAEEARVRRGRALAHDPQRRVARPLRPQRGEQRVHAVDIGVGASLEQRSAARGAEELLEEGGRRVGPDPQCELVQRVEQQHASSRHVRRTRKQHLSHLLRGARRGARLGRGFGSARGVGRRVGSGGRRPRGGGPGGRVLRGRPPVAERPIVNSEEPGQKRQAGQLGRQQPEVVRLGGQRVGGGRRVGARRLQHRVRRQGEQEQGEQRQRPK